MKRLLTALALASLLTYPVSSQTDPIERKIVEFVDKNQPTAVETLKRSVDIESATENIVGVKAVGSHLAKEFESIGMSTKWIGMPPEMKRAGHLVAETAGTRGKRLLLLGHLDTVLTGEKFKLDGSTAYGTGIADMKGGNVILLYALKALNDVGALKDTRIIVMLTGDEENSGDPVEISRGDMIAAAKKSDIALSFEGTIGDTATVGRRGASSWRIEIEAKTGHSSGIFRESMGNGAIFEASRILNEFREKLGGEKYLTFNPSLIVGGTTVETQDATGTASGKTNVVPAKVVIRGDLRFISEDQKTSARNRMREIVGRSLAGTSAKIAFEDGLPAMTPRPGNYELLKQLDKVSQDLGFGKVEVLDPGERGAGDVAFVSEIIPSLDGIGIGGGRNSHAKGESARIDTMAMLTKRAAILIYRLTR